MATYGDIESWAKILNESEESEKVWNEACETRKAEAAALDEKDLDGVEEIDPATLGMTEAEVDEAVEDVKAEDEEIDFSAYKLDEADDREPIVKAVKAVAPEVSVSTANLTGENSVRLAEAIEKLAEAVGSDDKRVDEGEPAYIAPAQDVMAYFAPNFKKAVKECDGLASTVICWRFANKGGMFNFEMGFNTEHDAIVLFYSKTHELTLGELSNWLKSKNKKMSDVKDVYVVYEEKIHSTGKIFVEDGKIVIEVSNKVRDDKRDEKVDFDLFENDEPKKAEDSGEASEEVGKADKAELNEETVGDVLPAEAGAKLDAIAAAAEGAGAEGIEEVPPVEALLRMPPKTAVQELIRVRDSYVRAMKGADQKRKDGLKAVVGAIDDFAAEIADRVKGRMPVIRHKEKIRMTPAMADINRGGGYQTGTGDPEEDKDNDLAGMVVRKIKDTNSKGEVTSWADLPYDQDPMIPPAGETREFDLEVDPERVGSNRARVDAEKAQKELEKSGMDRKVRDSWLFAPGGKGDIKADQAHRIAAELKGKSMTPAQWTAVLNAIPPAEREEFKKQELAAVDADTEMPGDVKAQWKKLIELMFSGDVQKLNVGELDRATLMAARGFGTGGERADGSKSRSTGALTQVKDKIVNQLLLITSRLMGVDENLCRDFEKALRTENYVSFGLEYLNFDDEGRLLGAFDVPRTDRKGNYITRNKVTGRHVRAAMRIRLMRELFDKLGVHAEVPNPERGVEQKNKFDKIVERLFARAYAAVPKGDEAGVWDAVFSRDGAGAAQEIPAETKAAVWDQLFKFHDKSVVRKSKTFLDGKQNERFQALVDKARDHIADITHDEAVDLVQLDIMRRRRTEPVQARDQAVREVAKHEGRGRPALEAYLKDRVKGFLAGESPNANFGNTDTNPDTHVEA